jgi:hypothetical protein
VGRLLYGSPPVAFDLDDRTLAHVEIVVIAKLRRSESFAFSLAGKGDARTSIWVSPASDLQFEYVGGTHDINRAWLEALIESANSPQGLRVSAEPESKPANGADASG